MLYLCIYIYIYTCVYRIVYNAMSRSSIAYSMTTTVWLLLLHHMRDMIDITSQYIDITLSCIHKFIVS